MVTPATPATQAVCDLSVHILGIDICAIGVTAVILVPAISVLICAIAWRIIKGGTISLFLSSFALFLIAMDLAWRIFHG